VRWPGGLGRPGETIHHIVEGVDLVPSLLEWAGIPRPAQLQGVPLPIGGCGGAGAPPPRDGPPRASALLEHAQGKSLRTDSYRYVVRAQGTEELYDLTQDLGEYANVIGDPKYAEALSEMRGELCRRLMALERPIPRIWPY
jgi:arylsulfatase